MEPVDSEEAMQKRIDRIDLILRWILGLFCLFLIVAALVSCGKKPIHEYKDGIYIPEENKY